MRNDGRKADEIRPVVLTPNFTAFAEGSVLISIGDTRVLCTATIEEGLPRWMQLEGRTSGWITAEYSMLPRATMQRTPRETSGLSGRTQEIRRMIGRSLRAAVDLDKLGARTCIIDCDVLQADGGTRTASVTGGYVALSIALRKLVKEDRVPEDTLLAPVAAVSTGVVDGVPLLDLNYAEDRRAEVDANIVMNSAGKFIEIQSTAEGRPFSSSMWNELLNLSYKGIGELLSVQKKVLDKI